MKKIIYSVSFLFIINIASVLANSTEFSDKLHNLGLYHCNSTNVTAWHTETPDDSSSGRIFNPALLEYTTDQPILTLRSGTDYCFYFDGNNDGLYIPNISGYIGWPGGKETFYTDLSFKFQTLPSSSGDNRAALIDAGVWQVFLRNDGSGNGYLQLLVYNTSNQSVTLDSSKVLSANAWYDFHAELTNGVLILTVGGVTNTTAMNGTLSQDTSHIEIGQGISAARYFQGYIDEIQYGFYPENYGITKIDNSDVIPEYKPDSQVTMDGNSPDWAKTLIMAELRIEKITEAGTFEAATHMLDHYEEMGVNGLWIDPIYKRSNSANNGYVNYGPHLFDENMTGTTDANASLNVIKNFVTEAHNRNIRIFFDIISWGVDYNSPLYSDHNSWFDGSYQTLGYKFDWGNSTMKEWFINQVTNLIISTGADGLRCDVEPALTGYDMYGEVRNRCYNAGRKVVIIAEQPCWRSGEYDFEQNGVGYITDDDWYKIRESGNYYISNNIVDGVKNGTAIGKPESPQGNKILYTYNLDNHDSIYPISLGNIIRFGYQAVLSPFIPMWFVGEEWDSYPHQEATLYFQTPQWVKLLDESNMRYFEKVKKLIRIRRMYPDIFDYYPSDHRNENICKISVSGNNLQSYARFANGKGVLVIPNFNNSANSYSFVPPYSDMGMSAATYKVIDLLTDEVILRKISPTTSINVSISSQNMAVLLVERDDYSAGPDTTAFWRFEEGTAGVAHSGHDDNWYVDSSGNGNHLSAWGTEVNPTATSDIPFNYIPLISKHNSLALKSTGTQNISTASDSPLNSYVFPDGFTVECMVKYNDFNFDVAVCKEGRPFTAYGDPNFCIKRRGSAPYPLQLQFFDGDGNQHDLRSNITPNTGTWYCVAAVCDGYSAKLYIKHPTGDYELVAEDIGTISGTALYDNDEKWIVGRGVWSDNPDNYLNGYVDEVRITNVALEVSQFLGNGTTPPSDSGKTAYWRFEEGTDGIAHSGHDDNWYIDSSGDDNNLSAWGSEVNPYATSDVPFDYIPLTYEQNLLALKFTGSENISTATDSPLNSYTFPDGFTVECMVKYNDFNFGVAICKDGNPFTPTYSDPNFCLKRRGSAPYPLQFQFFDGAGNRHDLRSDITPDTGIWYCVAAVCNGYDAKLYIKDNVGDYQLVAAETNTVSGSALYNDNQKWVVGRGAWGGNPDNYLNGFVDEVRITNVALSTELFLGSVPEPSLILGLIVLIGFFVRKYYN